MVNGNDLIQVAIPPELPPAGALYACRSLFNARDYPRASQMMAMRQIAAQAVVELSLQRYLTENGIPFGQEVVAPFNLPGHASLVLGRRLCQVIAIIHPHPLETGQIMSQAFLKASGLPLPADEGLPDAHEDEEFVIYAIVSRLPGAGGVQDIGQGMWVHPLPFAWAQPRPWHELGALDVKSESDIPIEVLLDGQNELRQYQTEVLKLLPAENQEIHPAFYALAVLRTTYLPTGNVEIRKGATRTYIIYPRQWVSLWHPGNQITLLGYLLRGETRQMRRLNPKRRYYPPSALHPLPALFDRVRKWAAEL